MKLRDRLKFFMTSGMRIILPAANSVIESETVFPIKITGISDSSSTVTVSIIQQTRTVTVVLPVVDGVAEGTAKTEFPGGTTFYIENDREVPAEKESVGLVEAASDTLRTSNKVLFWGIKSFELGTADTSIEKVGLVNSMGMGTANLAVEKIGLVDPIGLGTATITIEKL